MLYGSRARNDADPLSDIDLLVVVNNSEAKVAVDKSGAQVANKWSRMTANIAIVLNHS